MESIMRKSYLIVLLAIAVLGLAASGFAKAKADGNVFCVDDKGQKYFICPVLGNQGIVNDKTEYSDYEGMRYYFCCPGCKPKFDSEPKKYVSAFHLPGNVIKVADSKMTFICPVSGEEGVVSADTKYADYQGKRYYFCCPNCPPKFEKEPATYLKTLDKKMSEACGDHGSDKCKSCSGHGKMGM